MFFHKVGETEDQRRALEAEERAYFDREESSTQRAQNFGKRISTPEGEGISVPASYALNRAHFRDLARESVFPRERVSRA